MTETLERPAVPEADADPGARLRRELGLLTEDEIARLAAVKVKTVRNWRTTRAGPPFTRLGEVVVYRREAFLAWLQKQETDTD